MCPFGLCALDMDRLIYMEFVYQWFFLMNEFIVRE